ncbi:MAG: DEAD/DEAH box helicase [Elusimicrobia bacterium]|nr:DEAD/DEAH box helicase [Elusimicrobiota bacterium]
MPFTQLRLHPDLVKGVRAMGFTAPTPIQSQAIPPALEGRDVLGCAQTGSGKTAAFVLPILHHLLSRPGRHGCRVLVLVPTRELASQVDADFVSLGKFTPFKTGLVIGGVAYGPQRKSFAEGAQVLVATPGRMLDHLRQGSVRLDALEFLVLDEADRMLDMGFLPDIRQIIGRLPTDRQTMMFSATLEAEIQRVAAFALRDPQRVEVSRPTSVAEGISQVVYPVSQAQKPALMVALLESTQIRSGLVFCRTKHGADRLATKLKDLGFSIGVLHANRTQGQRTQAMESFRSGRTRILVATDIAARGIDVREISHVINYDVPGHPEDYIHRVGRTARAYGAGDAITLMAPDEQPFLTAIETFTGVVFPRAMLPNFPYSYPPVLTPPRPKTFKDMNWSKFKRRFRFSRPVRR